MKSLFRKHKQTSGNLLVYLKVRHFWAVKMNRITRDLSPSELGLYLIIFTLLGTVLCLYTALAGFLPEKRQSIHINEISVIKPLHTGETAGLNFIDQEVKADKNSLYISRLIDSIIKSSGPINVFQTGINRSEDFDSIKYCKKRNKTN